MAFNNGFYSPVPLVIIFFLSLITCSILAQKENESLEEDLVPVTHVLPKQIFNEGKPFYVDKDPVSGQLDFSSKKPAGIEPEINEVIDTQLKTVIFNSLSPNIHDYLNLPVKYSSSKFVYPLVSSSYANLKYQGNNKNYLSHNKEITASTTTSPKYYTFKKTTSAEKPSTIMTLSTTTKTPSTIILTTTTPAFSKKTTSVPSSTTQKKTTSTKSPPTTFSLPPTSIITSTRKVTTEATTTTSSTTKIATPTTDRPSTSNTQKSDKIHTNKNKFTTSTTPAIKISTQEKTTTTQVKTTTTQPKTTTTQAKTTTTQAKTTTTQMKTTQTHIPTTTTSRPTTTTKTIIHSSTAKTTGSHSTTSGGWIWKDANNNTNEQNSFHPISSTERPHMNTNQPSAFKPLPTRDALTFPTMNSSAAHNELSHKKDSNKMSLMDLFNALAEEDFPYNPTGYENDQTEDMSHRVMASQPAPFTLQKAPTTTNYFNEMTNSTNNDTIFSETIGNLPNTFNPENVRKNFHKENSNEQTEYVRYEIQQPTVVQHYRPITSANNVVILPDQNSASFILGSQQSVQSNTHMGTVDKVPLFENVNYITEKQAPEKLHSMNFTKDNSNDYKDDRHQSNSDWIPPQSLTSSLSFGYNQESNQNVHHSKVKFPSEEMALKTQSGQQNNEASQNPNQSQVSFPTDTDSKEPNQEFYNVDKINKVVFKDNNPPSFNPLDGQNMEQKKEILTLNKYNLQKKVNIPALAEDLTPPALPEYDQKVHQYPPVLHRHDEFTRKKFVPSSRPKVNHSLPNILPQFRPNAKISSGHSTYIKDPGNVRINNPKLRYPHRSLPPPPPPHSQYNNNRMPIGTRLNVKMVGNDDGNRRIFSVPVPTPPLHLQIIDRMFVKRPTISHVPTYGFNENYPMRKHFQPNMEPHRPLEITEKLFMEDDKIVNDSPREEKENEKEILKFEPVVTLQMLKTQKKSPTSPKISENIPNPKIPDSPQSPVYVVYPVQSSPSLDNMDSSMMVESKLDKRNPSSMDYSYSDLEYQNTPFTVQRDQPQEPVLMKVKEKQFLNSKIKFPYPLEKPDTPMIDRYGDSTFDLAPRIINRDIERKQDTYMNTEIPIAVAYTPTEPPNLFHMNYNNTRPEQYPQHSNNEFHTDEKNYEKDFMAPFFPSLSLGTITSAPNAANSWSIYSTSTEGYDKNYINRADTDTNQNLRPNGLDLTTKEFDSDRFQPELQGGFKPIYPPGYKIRDSDEEESKELLSASLINSNTFMNTTATTTIDTSTTTNPTPTSTTSKPTERKKSKLEASLESLLFGDDEDFEDDEEYISEKDSKYSPKS